MSEKRKILATNDGSTTLFDPKTGDNFHSFHGAETESLYVFIEKGLKYVENSRESVQILEVGLGTGLNLLLTHTEFGRSDLTSIKYVALEPFPVDQSLVSELQFKSLNDKNEADFFKTIHESNWEEWVGEENFKFYKSEAGLEEYITEMKFDLIYYDAFGPAYQPEMWGKDIINKVCSLMAPNGVLVSYCAQGQFRRNLQESGLKVERLPGPPGKREMIRGIKISN